MQAWAKPTPCLSLLSQVPSRHQCPHGSSPSPQQPSPSPHSDSVHQETFTAVKVKERGGGDGLQKADITLKGATKMPWTPPSKRQSTPVLVFHKTLQRGLIPAEPAKCTPPPTPLGPVTHRQLNRHIRQRPPRGAPVCKQVAGSVFPFPGQGYTPFPRRCLTCPGPSP